jgi:hypothetical protein
VLNKTSEKTEAPWRTFRRGVFLVAMRGRTRGGESSAESRTLDQATVEEPGGLSLCVDAGLSGES